MAGHVQAAFAGACQHRVAVGHGQRVAGDAFAARVGRLHRERTRLLDRLGILGTRLTDAVGDGQGGMDDTERLRLTLLRLSHDISHHHQRVTELVYDADGRDVGGSE